MDTPARLFLKPAHGRQVRIPNTNTHLPMCGAYVEESSYWRRRVQTGDAIPATPDEAAQAHATIDAVADLAEKALARAIADGGTAESASAALDELAAQAEPILAKGRELSESLDPRDAAQVEAYAITKLGATRAKLETMAGVAKKPAKAKK